MHLPYLRSRKQTTQKQTVAFRGVNYSQAIQDGQFEDCRNVSSRLFPCLTQREGREKGESYDNATAIWYKDGIPMVVDGTNLIYRDEVIGTVMPGAKQFANVNSKIVIFPDKVMYDVETKELRSLGAEVVIGSEALEFTDAKTLKVHLGAYRAEVVGSGKIDRVYEYNCPFPTGGKVDAVSVNAETGAVSITYGDSGLSTGSWANKLSVGQMFYEPSLGIDAKGATTSWAKITRITVQEHQDGLPGNYSKYYYFEYDRYEVRGTSYGSFSGFEALNFREGDTVEISGCTTYPDNNKEAITIRKITEEDTGSATVYGLVFDAASFTGKGVEAGEVTIRRKVPNLSIICESNNRLFGAEGNTIHVSALGDPTNFNTFDGVDTDSYAVAVATEGNFTACIGYENMVFFFKEDCLHKLMGQFPSEYQLYDYTVPGVLAGSQNSLLNINENVFYHGREGVYRYNGGTPDLISENFGLRRFDTAAAGAQGDRYYISMRDKRTGEWGMWVYDLARNIWLQEDNTQALCFARNGGELHYIDGPEQSIVMVNPAETEERFAWSATTCRMDEMYHNRKCYSKLLLRGELLEDSAWFQVDISCDGEPFKRVYTSRDKAAKTLAIPIMPRRCDSFRIRLSGEGKFIIRSLVREFGIGSEY